MKLRGRHWVMVWLAVFLGMATAVVARQKSALDVAARLRALRETRAALDARRAELERAIQAGSSAAALLPKVERSGLGLPSDTSYTFLSVGPTGGQRDR